MRPGDEVRLTLPARSEFVGVARSLVAGIASRLDLDLDQIEDVRLAVSEACAVVLPDVRPSSDLDVVLRLGEADLTVDISAPTSAEAMGTAESFAWTVLRALTDQADGEVAQGRLRVRLRFVAPVGSRSEQDAGAGLP